MAVAPAYMVVLMSLQALIGDRKLEASYADDPAWAAYRDGTGSLLPSARARSGVSTG